MKKTRKLVSGLLSLMLIVGLAGCGTTSSAPTEATAATKEESAGTDFTVIRFWNGFTGKDGEAMDVIVDNFNNELGDEYHVKVVVDKIPWDTLFTKITTTSSNLRSAPHIVAMSASRIAGMREKGVLTPLTGIEEFLGAHEDEYIGAAWRGGLDEDGVRYGFPIDVHPTAMYYNKDLISEDELPTTWDEFFKVCEEKTGDGVYGWAVPSMYSVTKDLFLNMLYTSGGSMFDKDFHPVYNSELGVTAITKLSEAVLGDNPISPKNVGAGGDQTLFVQGKSVFYFDGPWVLNSFGLLTNPNSNIGVAPCPSSTGEGDMNFAGSHQFTLMANTVTDEHTRELCYVFMRYVNEHSYEWALGGQVPALKSLHETDEYKALSALQPFTQMAYHSTLGEIEYEYWYECYNMMGVAVSNAIAGQYAPDEALNVGVRDFENWLIDETT